MCFNNKAYDVLKWVATVFLPAMAMLYLSLSSIWGLPYAEQVAGTITAVNTLLGILLGISTVNYKGDGTIIFDPNADAVIQTTGEFTDLQDKKRVMLTVETSDTLIDDLLEETESANLE